MIGRVILVAIWTGTLAHPVEAADISGNVTVVSDYRFRGISLSNGQPAVQAELAFEDDSGFYAGAWTSTIKEQGGMLAAELQLYAGHEIAVADGLTIDLSANYYAYPGDRDSNYVEGTGIVRLERGNASAGLGYSFVPKQAGTRDETGSHRNSYVFAEAAYDVPGTAVSLNASVGHESGYFDETGDGGKWDWAAGAELAIAAAKIGVAYFGSNSASGDDCLVASVAVEF